MSTIAKIKNTHDDTELQLQNQIPEEPKLKKELIPEVPQLLPKPLAQQQKESLFQAFDKLPVLEYKKVVTSQMNMTHARLLELLPDEADEDPIFKDIRIIQMNLEERWELIAKLEEEKEEREYQEETSSNDTASIKSESAYQLVMEPVELLYEEEDTSVVESTTEVAALAQLRQFKGEEEPDKEIKWTIEGMEQEIELKEKLK